MKLILQKVKLKKTSNQAQTLNYVSTASNLVDSKKWISV